MTIVDMKKVADGVFKKYPEQNIVYVASDGQAFFEEMCGRNHATAKKLELKKFERKAVDTKDNK